ncbi:MAG: hypothetical protein ACW981_06725 [Candidatus Hodarchaeales archaeon]|jgi:hypothetical protein
MKEPLIYQLEVNSIETDKENSNLQDFDPMKDKDEWIDIFTSNYKLPRDEVLKFVDSLRKSEDLIAHVVFRENGKIVGTFALNKNPDNPSIGYLIAIHANKREHLEKLISYLKPICIKNEIKRLQMTFTHLSEDSPEIIRYANIGFERAID